MSISKIKEIKIREEDGSYSDPIPMGADAINIDTANGSNLETDLANINKNLNNKTNQINNLQNKDINLQNQINSLASGSPKGVYSTINELISANPDTGVYIITENGHIYSWTKNGSSAIDLGVYQAADIEDNSTIIEIKKLITEEDNKILSHTSNLYIDKYTEKVFGFVTENGTIYDTNSYFILKIRTKPNTIYTCTHLRHFMNFRDLDGNFVGFAGNNSVDHYNYTFTTPNKGYYSWIVVPVTEDLSKYMVVEGDTMPSEYIKGEINLQQYIHFNGVSAYLNIYPSEKVIYKTSTTELIFPSGSVIFNGKGFTLKSQTIILNETPDVDHSYLLLFDYNSNSIISTSWKNSNTTLPIIGICYEHKIFINGVYNKQIFIYNENNIETNQTYQEGMLCIKDGDKIIYDYSKKTLTIPSGNFIINNSIGYPTKDTTLELADILKENACKILYNNTKGFYATAWSSQNNIEPNDCVIGYIYRKNVFINGISPNLIYTKLQTIYCFGDSITAGVGCNNPYHVYFSKYNNYIICKNYGIGSTGYVVNTSDNVCVGNGVEGKGQYRKENGNNTILKVMQSIEENIDRCIIAAGTNDYGSNINIDTFRTAVQNTLDYALTKTTRILVLTPIKRINYQNTNSQGKTLKDYTDVLIEECELRGIAYCDGFYVSINPNNNTNKQTYIPDGLHPNDLGHQRMARHYQQKLIEGLDL